MTVELLGQIIKLFAPSMDDYLYVCDFKEDYYQISPGAEQRFLMPADHFYHITETHRNFVYAEDWPKVQEELRMLQEGEKTTHNIQYRWLNRDGHPIWINCRGQILADEDGSPHFLVGCINEIGKKQVADNISGLLGESGFRTFYENFGRNIPRGFLLRIGIDDFKDINESHGIAYGDFILRQTAECIERCIHSGQYLFKIVADEFMVMDVTGATAQDAKLLYRQIRSEIMSFVEDNQYKAVYTVSGGILTDGREEHTYDNTMKLTEFALGEAKRIGKNSFYIFEQDAYDAYIERRKMLRKFYRAVRHDFEGFEVYFQPIVDAQDGRLTGAEALLRFKTPQGIYLSPNVFIPILEESGLIIPVGRWVLRKALETCRDWQQFIPDFKVNVNLSYIQVAKSQVLPEIISQVDAVGVKPSSLCIELTESGYLEENQHFTKVWNGLKEYGVLLALDDFGTGYSNLHCLCDLKPTYVKLDRTFIMKACCRDYEYQLLCHIVEMAHSLGLLVCAEGIETDAELAKVRQTEPDAIQGYYFGKPCSQDEFHERFILTSK
jgi:diguanylate cyclase (GGDEF)-like protein